MLPWSLSKMLCFVSKCFQQSNCLIRQLAYLTFWHSHGVFIIIIINLLLCTAKWATPMFTVCSLLLYGLCTLTLAHIEGKSSNPYRCSVEIMTCSLAKKHAQLTLLHKQVRTHVQVAFTCATYDYNMTFILNSFYFYGICVGCSCNINKCFTC